MLVGKTLYNVIKRSNGPDNYATYTDVTDHDLDQLVRRITTQHPNNGEVMIAGYLASEGIRVPRSKLRLSIHRVDPEGQNSRHCQI